MPNELLLIVDAGCADIQETARVIRNKGVYCEVTSLEKAGEEIKKQSPKGVIVAGGAEGKIDFDGGRTLRLLDGDEKNDPTIDSFLKDKCAFSSSWNVGSFVKEAIAAIKEKIGEKTAICALSGGVDSSVCAVMANAAIGKNLTCILVDHGLLRKNEAEAVEKVFRGGFDVNLIKVDARERFLNKLKGVTDPEQKRKIIGSEFITVFEEEAKKIGGADFLIQGTIYPDVIESGIGGKGVIKSHHNVGGMPEKVGFKEIIEPLRPLFKNEVREAGLELGLPESIVRRQPFPGPGLGVRVIGEITAEKLDILREADAIFREEVENAGLAPQIAQYFAIITDLKSVGVKNDERTYDYTIALRAVVSKDFMTAVWAKIPLDVLEKVSDRITSEVKGVNRVVYDISKKPPATVEWE